MSVFSAKQHDKFAGAAFEIITVVQYSFKPDERMKRIAATYSPWAGLAEAQKWRADEVMEILKGMDQRHARSEPAIKAIEDIYEMYELPPNHAYGVLLQHKTLIPYFNALKTRYTKPVETSKPTPPHDLPQPELPVIVAKSPLNAEDAKKPDVPAARIDRAIEDWLAGMKLNNRQNVSDMRLYLSIVGASILSGHNKARRDMIFFNAGIVHALAAKTATDQENERERVKREKAAKQAERAQKQAARKAEKEARKRAKNPNNTGTGNARTTAPVSGGQ